MLSIPRVHTPTAEEGWFFLVNLLYSESSLSYIGGGGIHPYYWIRTPTPRIHSTATAVWVQILLFISTTSLVDTPFVMNCCPQEFNRDFTKAYCGARSPPRTFPLTWDVGRMQFRSQGPSLPHPALGALRKSFRASLKTETLSVTHSDKTTRFFFSDFIFRRKPSYSFLHQN